MLDLIQAGKKDQTEATVRADLAKAKAPVEKPVTGEGADCLGFAC